MNIVKDLQSLIQLMHSQNEVIIFPIGGEGQQLLDFLRYTNFLNRVCCIAAPEVHGGVEQKFIYEVPVIPFENLVHFRETAMLIVSAPEQFHTEIDAELTRFGFKTVVFVRNDVHVQVRNELQKMYSSGQIMTWYVLRFDEKISALQRQLEEQNNIADVNTKAFEKFRNAFRGKDIVIVAGGPTVNYYRAMPGAIHIGLNFAWKREDIPLDFLITGDNNINTPDRRVEDGFAKIKNTIFIGKSRSDQVYNWIRFPEHRNISTSNIKLFYGATADKAQYLHQDICRHGLADFFSGSFCALHFSLFTYPKRIYLVGCDTSPTGHFYAESKELDKQSKSGMNSSAKFMKVGYARMKMFAKHYYPDTEIISINPVGLRGLFKDVYTDEYKAVLAEQEKLKE